MKVKAIKDYYDLELKKDIKAGDEYDVTEARAKELSTTANKAKQALVEIIEAPTPTTEKVVKPRSTKKKAEV